MSERKNGEPERAPLAIVGIGCRFPGGVTTPDTYWDLLCAGTDATRELPLDRWDVEKFYDPDPAKLGKMSTFRGGFLDRVDQFDAQFFGISPREAVRLDPQQRLLLQTAWEAFEDAGQDVDRLAGGDVGVFVGGFTLDYNLLQTYGVRSRYELQAHSATGMMMTMLANRLSHAFDLRGPSLTVDTACSGSLVALHVAAQAVWAGECSLALVGGVNLMLAPTMTIVESKGGFLSPDGRCKAFDAAADGYARGEGAGVVVLKPLPRAEADGDSIYALVRGTAVTQDGHTDGITVPNGSSQETAMRLAYARAGVSPHEVRYIEAHGTGTPVGDPIEAAAIGRVLSTNRPVGDPLLVGSVKTNIGHLEAAAGVAGLIKAALVLRHGRIPAHLHLANPNPAIAFGELGVRIPTRLTPWPTGAGPRYAGVNSFGFGGTNAHALLQQGPTEPVPTRDDGRRRVVALSARSAEALRDLADATCRFLGDTGHSLADVSYSSTERRTRHEHRMVVVAGSTAEARDRLRAHLVDEDRAVGVVTGSVPSGAAPKLAFVFSGMGPQWWGMGRGLLTTEPVFRAAVEECDAELRKYTGWSLVEELLAAEEKSRMAETEVAQPANFALQIGLVALWRSWGVEPDAVVGHSAGEVAAHHTAGVLSLADATRVIYYRSVLQQRTSDTGRMLAVSMAAETLDRAVADAGPKVSVAAVNSPSAVTLSGDPAALEDIATELATFGVPHRFLPFKVPFHSHYMDPLRDELEARLAGLQPATARLPLYSTVLGSRIDGSRADARYWWQNVRATVLFSAALSELVGEGYTHFVELSPHPVLAGPVRESLALAGHDGLVLPSLRNDEDDEEILARSAGALHSHGHSVDWTSLHPAEARFVRLPTYPWQLQTYWNETAEGREDSHYEQVHPLLGQLMGAAHPTWEREVDIDRLAYLADHRIQDNTLLPTAALVEMMLSAAHEVYGAGTFGIEDLRLPKALILDQVSDARLRTTLYQDQARVEISSYLALPGGDQRWMVHATAQLRMGAATAAPHDLAALRAACGVPIAQDAFYAKTRDLGFQYGPTFRTVRELAVGEHVAVGSIAVPEAIADELPGYLFHPCLLDAAFQVLLSMAAPPDDGAAPATPYLPVGISGIRVLAPPVAEMTVAAHVATADQSRIVSDLTLCDPTGRVLVEIEGFEAQSLAAVASRSPERIDRDLYELRWQEAPATSTAGPGGTGTWVVFTDSTGVGAEVAAALRADGQRVFSIAHGAVGEPHHHGDDACTIDASNSAHYAHLMKTLDECEIGKVVHLWSLDADFSETRSARDLETIQETGVLSVTWLMRALSAELSSTPKVWLVTRGAQPVGDDPPNPGQAPMWGLGRVLGHQEFPATWGGLIDTDPHAPAAVVARQLVGEIAADDLEDQVAFRAEGRYVARITESPGLTPPFPARMRAAGSYLVTGGLGSLGLLVARFLIERGARELVLMGRTPVPDRSRWDTLSEEDPQRGLVDELRRLEALGARLHFAAVDVADPDQLRRWMAAHRDQGRPAVVGVVHTAGVVEDELLLRMDRAKFRKVLRPKLAGGWLLHQLFRESDLDFFVLFSSAGSVLASPGQGNYAAANAFLDALAHYRRGHGLPALSVGWGPWSTGMAEQLDLAGTYARRGIELITPEAGTQILSRVLHQQPAHLMSITVDWATARETSPAGKLPPMFGELAARVGPEDPDDSGSADQSLLVDLRQAGRPERAELLGDYLRDVTARVLGLDAERVGADETLYDLGMDSIMAIEMKQRIEATLKIEVSVLDLLQGATITVLSEGLLARLNLGNAEAEPDSSVHSGTADQPDELELLLTQISPEELETLLGELEADDSEVDPGASDGQVTSWANANRQQDA